MKRMDRQGNFKIVHGQNKNYQNRNDSHVTSYLATLILASFIGTYLDLWLVGKGFYSFPIRPFPSIFSINILFTLVFLPAITFFIIFIFNRINLILKGIVSIVVSVFAGLFEHFSEQKGFFTCSDGWKHLYSIVGYFLFIILIWHFYKWMRKRR